MIVFIFSLQAVFVDEKKPAVGVKVFQKTKMTMEGSISKDVRLQNNVSNIFKDFVLKMFADAEELLESMPKIKRRV